MQASAVAVDTESNSLYAYQEQVCLVQFSTPEADYLVDPLALKREGMEILAPLFSAPQIEKIFHAAEYDLICLSRDFGFQFNNVFDTMWAATVLGWSEVGLSSILSLTFNVHLNKRYQQANWGIRPLPMKYLEYAVQDTHYLIPLSQELKKQLHQTQRLELFQEDCTHLTRINGTKDPQFNEFQSAKQHAAQKAQAYQFSRRQTAVLQELYLFRLKIARQYNQPVYRIIPEKALISLASCLPRDRHALQQCPELSSKLIRKFGDGLIQTIQRALQMPPSEVELHSQKTIQDERVQKRYEALKRWRKYQALQMGVKSDVVLPKHLLEVLSHHQPANIEDLHSLMKEYPYRANHFGSAIFQILSHS